MSATGCLEKEVKSQSCLSCKLQLQNFIFQALNYKNKNTRNVNILSIKETPLLFFPTAFQQSLLCTAGLGVIFTFKLPSHLILNNCFRACRRSFPLLHKETQTHARSNQQKYPEICPHERNTLQHILYTVT